MDVALHLRVLWRFKVVLIAGLLVGIAMAVLGAYRVTFDGVPTFTARGAEEWTSRSEVLVTQPGFPWGRVTLPGTGEPGAPTALLQATRRKGKSALQFADPGRFSTLASVYSVISLSDRARERLPERVSPGQIQALPLSLDAASGIVLPVVVIVTKHSTASKARKLNADVVVALRGRLLEQQRRAKIAPNQRVKLQTLNFPSAGQRTVGRSYTTSIIAFVLCLVCTIAWTHILHNLRGRADAARWVAPSHSAS
jgi:hypothetical protein